MCWVSAQSFLPQALAVVLFRAHVVLEAVAVQRDPLQRQITSAVLAADVPPGVQGHV